MIPPHRAGGDPAEPDASVAESSAASARSSDRAAFLSLAERGVVMRLEPIHDLQTGAVYGYAARTDGFREMGFAVDHALFDRAVELDAIEALEEARIRRAFQELGAMKLATRPHLFISLDTRLLLSRPGLAARLDAAFDAIGRPGRLTFELYERHRPGREAELARAIAALRARGARIALTPLGAGRSDLEALAAYDLDVIKVAGACVDGVARNDRKRLLAGQMAVLARHLGMKALCAGVLREEDLRVCRELGFDLAQGPHLAERPLGRASESTPAPPRRRDCGVAAALDYIEPAHRDTPLFEIASRFRHPDHPPLCPIVGDCGEPLGAVRERDFRPFAFSSFGLDLIRNRTRPVRLEQMMRPYPQADVESDCDRLTALLAQTDLDGLLITNGVRYVGFMPAERLVRLCTAQRLAEAQDANPLTGLPGNRVVAAFMDQAIAETARNRILCYLDFDNFKPFNDVYGFRTGDRAIMLFADILKQSFPEEVVCHIGGDDFFIGATGRPEAPFFQTLEEVLRRFQTEAESFYSPEDRAMGGLLAKGRDGAPRRFPMLRCSAGVMLVAEGQTVQSVETLARSIARVKRRAKEAASPIARMRFRDGDADRAAGPEGPLPVAVAMLET